MLKPDVENDIEEYLQKARSVTSYELANKFGIRMSVARRLLRKKEAEGVLVPYVRDGGFEVYTSPAELKRKETERPIMIADALEMVSASVPKDSVITEEMDAALIAASRMDEVIKPGRLARQRREAGVRKEQKKDRRPEVVVEPLMPEEQVEPEPAPEPKERPKKPPKKKAERTKKPAKKEAEPKKKTEPKKKPAGKKDTTAEEKPKKKVTKKEAEPKAEKPKKKASKKADAKEEKPKKTRKKTEAKEEKPKTAAKKKDNIR
ncbi:MAG: hypothetical protein ACFFAY_12260, partial [Promethearchaeota archaeon]